MLVLLRLCVSWGWLSGEGLWWDDGVVPLTCTAPLEVSQHRELSGVVSKPCCSKQREVFLLSFSHYLVYVMLTSVLYIFASYKNSHEYLQMYTQRQALLCFQKQGIKYFAEYGILFTVKRKVLCVLFWSCFTIFREWFCSLVRRRSKGSWESRNGCFSSVLLAPYVLYVLLEKY